MERAEHKRWNINLASLFGKKERLSVWRKARGLWKKKKPDPIMELRRMRREW